MRKLAQAALSATIALAAIAAVPTAASAEGSWSRGAFSCVSSTGAGAFVIRSTARGNISHGVWATSGAQLTWSKGAVNYIALKITSTGQMTGQGASIAAWDYGSGSSRVIGSVVSQDSRCG